MTILSLFTCHNRIEKTKSCITALENCNASFDFDFIVADDCSTDGTLEFLKSRDNVTVVECDGNAFYSGGMRAAIAAAKKHIEQDDKVYDYVLLLNDDFTCYENGIGRMVDMSRAAHDNGDNAIIVASTEGESGQCSYSGVLRLSKLKAKFGRVLKGCDDEIFMKADGPYNFSALKADTFNANCVLIPTDIFMALPNMDPVYVHSLGDFDYGFMAGREGYMIYATPFFAGHCADDHDIKGSWRDSSLPARVRLQKKEHPLGQPGRQWFHFLRKNFNIFTAIAYWANDYIKIFLRR